MGSLMPDYFVSHAVNDAPWLTLEQLETAWERMEQQTYRPPQFVFSLREIENGLAALVTGEPQADLDRRFGHLYRGTVRAMSDTSDTTSTSDPVTPDAPEHVEGQAIEPDIFVVPNTDQVGNDTDEAMSDDAPVDGPGPVVGPTEDADTALTDEEREQLRDEMPDVDAADGVQRVLDREGIEDDDAFVAFDMDAPTTVDEKAEAVRDLADDIKQRALSEAQMMAEAGFTGAHIDPISGAIVTSGGTPVTPVPDPDSPKGSSSTVERGGSVAF